MFWGHAGFASQIYPQYEYKFLCNLESITDASEFAADSERLIKSTFSVVTKAYLLPEYTNSVVTNKISQLQKRRDISVSNLIIST